MATAKKSRYKPVDYIEPRSYFPPSALKIAREWDKEHAKKTAKKSTTKKSK